MEIIFDSRKLEDVKLDPNSGRIVLYGPYGLASTGNRGDHNDLLRGLARRHNLDLQDVISNAIRLYYTFQRDAIYVTERRKIDYDYMSRNFEFYEDLIKRVVK
jgi:hypothetical protein